MSINIQARPDYGSLFNSIGKNASSNVFSAFGGSSSISSLTSTVLGNSTGSGYSLGDYASIKNGSYYKLMKSYYNMKASDDTKTDTTTDKKIDQTTDKKTNGATDKVTVDKVVGDKVNSKDSTYTANGKTANVVANTFGSYLDEIV